MKELKDGVYYDISETEYHKIQRLSASHIKNILKSPADFWYYSWFNPNLEEQEPSYPQFVGSAYHKFILERDKFYKEYALLFDKDHYPNALDTMNDLKAYLREHDLKVSGSKAELIDRILEHDANVEILQVIEDKYLEKHKGKKFISVDLLDQINSTVDVINRNEGLSNFINKAAKEVTILWTHSSGAKMKCRIDAYHKGSILDLKTFTYSSSKNVRKYIIDNIIQYKYHVQGQVYLDAVINAAEFDDRFKSDAYTFGLLFCRTGDIPYIELLELGGGLEIMGRASELYSMAIEMFWDYVEKFGDKYRWVVEPEFTALSDDDFPIWAYD